MTYDVQILRKLQRLERQDQRELRQLAIVDKSVSHCRARASYPHWAGKQ